MGDGDSCIGMDYDYVIDVIAGSKACIADYSAIQVYITAVWANYRRIRDEGRDGKEDGAGKEGKEGGERGGKRKCKEARVKYGGFIDGSHEWGREGSGDRRRVAMEENGVLVAWTIESNCEFTDSNFSMHFQFQHGKLMRRL